MTSDVAIRLATRRDIPAMMALEARYYVANLDPSERAKGFISDLHSQDWFTWGGGLRWNACCGRR
jgi:hypothetical protein